MCRSSHGTSIACDNRGDGSAHDAPPFWRGKDTAALQDLFRSIHMPNATCERQRWFSGLLREIASAERPAATMLAG